MPFYPSVMPAVSVIIPVYGVEPYIARCVRSLFGQTLQDIEYVFVDDCSPDNSMGIMRQILEEEFPDRIPQVKILRMPQNSGQAKVRMQGLAMATGDYVIHCDADDFVEVIAYERMYAMAVSGAYDMVICDFRMGDDSSWKTISAGSLPGEELSDILTGAVMGSLWCRLVKREWTLDLISPASNMAEDLVLTIQFTAKAHRIGHIEEPLYYYYIRPDSISHTPGMSAALARQEAIYTNARLCVELLQSRYGFDERNADLVYYKYRARHYLEPYVQHREVYKKWCDTFPEINGYFLKTGGIPFEEKFWFVLIRLHLYHAWKSVTNLFRR